MAGDPGQAAPMVIELDELMLDAKLAIPRPRAGAVSRVDLVDAARGSGCQVVGVTAPAGYGKSTFLSQWAITEQRRVIWVSLDRLDDDPSALVTLLASAYSRGTSDQRDIFNAVGNRRMSALGRAAPRLATAFRTSPEPFVLMLDDLQELRSPESHDVLTVVISGIPDGSQFVSASRSEQPHLPRLRASGEAQEFLASDLALDSNGVEQIFSTADVSLSPDMAKTVVTRTEGWPAGIYLTALIARGDDDALTVTGDDPYLADYLYRESLSRLPESDRTFLRRTSVLEQFCAPLCDVVVGERGSQERLRHLESTNSFLIPLDRRREWFRYHGLFREFLEGELRRVEPDVATSIHLQAADWFEEHGSPGLALEHLLKTEQVDRTLRLANQLIPPTYQKGQMSKVQRWLTQLGDPAIASYPPLAVLAGWVAALTGQDLEAERWADIIDASSFDGVPADGTASFESGRAMLRGTMADHGPEQALADTDLAVEQEPPWSPWRDQALCASGEALLIVGENARARTRFEEATEAASRNSNPDIVALAEASLALLDMSAGRWAEASSHVDVVLVAIEEARMDDYATSVLAFAAAARLAVHQGNQAEAERQLTRAMRARPNLTYSLPSQAVRSRLHMARAYWAIGDQGTARHLVREIDDILSHRPSLGILLDAVAELREAFDSHSPAGTSGPIPLTPAELRLLPYLQTHLTIREIGTRLFVSRNTVSSEVGSIYRKLGVSSRHDAVERATAIGLLGG